METALKNKTGSSRSYTPRTIKLLWGRAAGRCAVPACRVELFIEATDYDPVVSIGDIAHIQAASDGGPRANLSFSSKDRDNYDNLILLWKNCHAKFDTQKYTHTVEFMQELKRNHEAWVRASLPERGKSRTGWKALILRAEHPVDQAVLHAALVPDFIEGNTIEIHAKTMTNEWARTQETIGRSVGDLLKNVPLEDSRFAIFPLAAVSACIYLGYCLTNRPRVQLFQYHRDGQTWVWPQATLDRQGLSVTTIKPHSNPTDIAFLFELSAKIRVRSSEILPADTMLLSIGVDRPGTDWLHHPTQIQELGRATRQVFEDCMNDYPGIIRWHIFYAGPAPGAVAIGQQLNPTMIPAVQLYEYRHPSHVPSLLINS